MRAIAFYLCLGIVVGRADNKSEQPERPEQPFDNADIPSWIPGVPGIDKGTIHFTYKKDAIEVILLLLFGWFYKRHITSKRPALPVANEADDFKTGAFSCAERPCNCLWAFFFQQVRMGDTFEVKCHDVKEGFLLSSCLEPASGLQLRLCFQSRHQAAPDLQYELWSPAPVMTI
eukprot:Skav229264  [mRNA]  locus=scaffold952:140092:145481:- [translate_table: standard]